MTIRLLMCVAVLVAFANAPAGAQSGYDLFQKALAAERGDGNLRAAIQLYERVVREYPKDRALVARALVRIADCHEKLGQRDASTIYERIVREFADQSDSVSLARARLSALRSPSLPPSQTVRQVWSGADVDPMGQPSGDGRYLSFTNWNTGDLAVRDLVAGTSRHVTNTGGWDRSGDFAESSLMSADGTQIAYAWFTDKGRDPNGKCVCRYDLRIVSASGADAVPRVLHSSAETSWIAPTSWTPDGKELLVTRMIGPNQLQLAFVSVANGSLRIVEPYPRMDADQPRLSPDGRLIAMESPQANSMAIHDIEIISADGNSRWMLIDHPAHDRAPIWALDGSNMMFISDRTGEDALWRVPLTPAGRAAGPPVMVLAGLGSSSTLLGITRSGALYYGSGGPNVNVYAAEFDADHRLVKPPTVAVNRFLNGNSNPSPSPDGRLLAFLSRRGGRRTTMLAIQDRATGQTRDIALPWVVTDRVEWFPDSKAVLAATVEERRMVYFKIDLAGGDPVRVRATRGRQMPARRPLLSADGRTLYYSDDDTDTIGAASNLLKRFDLVTGEDTVIRRMTGDGERFGSFAVSPDGKLIAYHRLDGPARLSILELMTAEGVFVRELYRLKDSGPARFAGLAWTPDQQYIVFPRPVALLTEGMSLGRVRTTGGEPEDLGISMIGPIKLSSFSGRQLYFSAVDGRSAQAVSVIENYLPRK